MENNFLKVSTILASDKEANLTKRWRWLLIYALAFMLSACGKTENSTVQQAGAPIEKTQNASNPSSTIAAVTSENTTASLAVAYHAQPPLGKIVDIGNWRYRTDVDPMNETLLKRAATSATELLHFQFPYQGGSNAYLQVRHRKSDGLNIILGIDKGHFLCSRSNGCSVQVKFDDEPAFTVGADQPEDYSNDHVYLRQGHKLFRKIKSSKVVRIKASFYKEGDRVMMFNTEGLVFDLPERQSNSKKNKGA